MRSYRFLQVDVFTREAFGGNQLAIFPAAERLADQQMQAIAREMNFSESTFVLPARDGPAAARVRIFTPARELPFAGHPVVGTGWALGVERGVEQLTLQLASGSCPVTVQPGDGWRGSAWMEQPLPRFRPVASEPTELAALVGLDASDLEPGLPAEFGSAGVEFLYLPLRSLEAVQRAHASADALRRFFGQHDHPAVYLFSLEGLSPTAAAHARMLSLLLGQEVREDPATGSAAGPLGAYLVRHGVRPPGRLLVEQGYELQRPSQLEVEVQTENGRVARVSVGGGVVKVAEGQLFV